MATQAFEIKDFSGGDYGRMEAWKAPKNSFSALNMIVTRTGELCVRPGLRKTTPTGIVNGAVWGMGRLPGAPFSIWYGQGTAIKYFSPSSTPGAIASATGALTGTPGAGSVSIDETGSTTYIATNSANGYSFNGTAITSLNNMPNSQALALYGDRLAVVPTGSPNTVQFSAAASFNDWTVSAGHAVSVTVGDTDGITALFAQRGHLALLKQASSLYVLTGTPGTNEALRPVYRFNGPNSQRAAGRIHSDDKIWFAPTFSGYAVSFDGTAVSLLDNIPLSLHTGLLPRTILPLYDDDQAGLAVLTPAGSTAANEIWLKYRGAWTKHTMSQTLSNDAAVKTHGYPQDGDATISRVRYGSCLVFTDGGGASAHPNFYTWQPFMDRPGLEADPFSASAERAGDDSSSPVVGNVTFPEQKVDDGSELMVRGVIVDFRSWNTGSATNNHFDLAVNTLNSYQTAGPVSSATASFDEAAASSSLAGTVRSKYFSFGDQGRGAGFQLVLTNCKGVAFQRFRIIAETYTARI
jgi:hypothetical protein